MASLPSVEAARASSPASHRSAASTLQPCFGSSAAASALGLAGTRSQGIGRPHSTRARHRCGPDTEEGPLFLGAVAEAGPIVASPYRSTSTLLRAATRRASRLPP